MIGYYEITKAFNDQLKADEDINTVVIGDDISKLNFDKQTIFALAHILVGAFREPSDAILEFDITVSVMDIVDENNSSFRDIANGERWKGLDNTQDVLNTMGGVLVRLTRSVRNGDMLDMDYELVGVPTAEQFQDRFENKLTGWSRTYTIQIPNTERGC